MDIKKYKELEKMYDQLCEKLEAMFDHKNEEYRSRSLEIFSFSVDRLAQMVVWDMEQIQQVDLFFDTNSIKKDLQERRNRIMEILLKESQELKELHIKLVNIRLEEEKKWKNKIHGFVDSKIDKERL